MSQKNYDLSKEERREYNRRMLRSAFKSLFWNAFSAKNNSINYKLQDLADALNKDKSVVSRWFSSEPNWTIDSIADIADALGLELQLQAIHQESGAIYNATGVLENRSKYSLDWDLFQKDLGILTHEVTGFLYHPSETPGEILPSERKKSAMDTHNCRAISSGTAIPSETYLFVHRPATRLRRIWERETGNSR